MHFNSCHIPDKTWKLLAEGEVIQSYIFGNVLGSFGIQDVFQLFLCEDEIMKIKPFELFQIYAVG